MAKKRSGDENQVLPVSGVQDKQVQCPQGKFN